MYRVLLQRRSFLFLWLSQIAATLAVQLYKIGVMVAVFDQTGSALQTAGVLVATSLPYVVVGQVAGALVDRYPRKRVLLVVQVAQTLVVAGSVYLISGAAINVWVAYAVVALLSLADAFYKPALLATLPAVVEKEEIVHANSLVNSTNYGVLAIGYALGGVLILQVGLSMVVVINLALFMVAAGLVTQLRVPVAASEALAAATHDPIVRSIRQGLGYLRRHDVARALIVMEFLEHWPHAVWTAALMLAFTTDVLQVSEAFWGYQNAIYFGGNIVGAAMAVAFAARLGERPGWVIIINAVLMAALTAVYAVSTNIWFVLVIVLVFGPPMALRDVAQDSLLQATVDGGMLGRVYATRQMLAQLAFMVGGLLLAALADVVDVRTVYLLGAALYFLTAFYALAQRALRRAVISTQPITVLETGGG